MKKGLIVLMVCLVMLLVGFKVSVADGPVRPIEDGSASSNIIEEWSLSPMFDESHSTNGPVRPIED